jgi:hypothetical protein
MIGVVTRESERQVVGEFFELFKTPWEHYQKGKDYHAIILSHDQTVDSLRTRLVILLGKGGTNLDRELGIISVNNPRLQSFVYNQLCVPIYTGLSTFKNVPKEDSLFGRSGDVLGYRILQNETTILRIGYDFFEEIGYLFAEGQPAENASTPSLEIHIEFLRTWLLDAGIPLVEIPPIPDGHSFIVCLTHDADFVRIRDHIFDYTMLGFICRALFGSFVGFISGKIPASRMLKNWRAVFSLPFVFLSIIDDFWYAFDRYSEIEKHQTSTFFLIPFKRRRGDKVSSATRAAKYDIMDIRETVKGLIRKGHEIGVHGIDAWHSQEKGSRELERISSVTGSKKAGIRTHWLLFNHQTISALEEAGYYYDSSLGYNAAVGYRNGTAQVFRPTGATRLRELPLNIQDTSLFYRERMNLNERRAFAFCELLINNAVRFGGILTINWHQRSLAPERLWGDFYVLLLEKLRARNPWFATGSQAVDWFQKRRNASFNEYLDQEGQLRLAAKSSEVPDLPRLILRIHRTRAQASRNSKHPDSSGSSSDYIDIPWTGDSEMTVATSSLAMPLNQLEK